MQLQIEVKCNPEPPHCEKSVHLQENHDLEKKDVEFRGWPRNGSDGGIMAKINSGEFEFPSPCLTRIWHLPSSYHYRL